MRIALTLSFLLVFNMIASAQASIGGIINAYTKIFAEETSGCAHQLTVEDSNDFEAGDRVMLIQMQGVVINESNTSDFGVIESINAAGTYVFDEIESLSAPNIITLKCNDTYPEGTFDFENGSVQLIRVPVYDDVEVTETLSALPWNGSIGGVLVFEVQGMLTLSADIDVSGIGFRGATPEINNNNDCSFVLVQDDYYYPENNWRGAAKGEGLAKVISGKEHGRGPQANGGGGGNDHNAGGGGGANAGKGGDGGQNYEPSLFGCDGTVPGIGGIINPTDFNTLYLGGGGGAGHGNNDNATGGANGGGIALIIADTIASQGGAIRANGATVPLGGGDGAGGGGAGGMVRVDTKVLLTPINVECIGGDGGSIDNSNAERCHGPGGGGGGGLLITNLPETSDFNFNVEGGAAGVSMNSSSCSDGTNEATDGLIGYVIYYGQVPGFEACNDSPAINADFTFSLGTNGMVSFSNSSSNYETSEWDFDGLGMSIDDNPSFTFPAEGSYSVTLIVQSACTSDTITQVIMVPEFVQNTVNVEYSFDDGNGCVPHTIQFSNLSTGTYSGLEWTFEGGIPETTNLPNPEVQYNIPGTYGVKLELTTSSDTFVLYNPAQVVVTPEVDAMFTYTIDDNTISFINESSNANNYQWDFGDNSPFSFEENPVHTYAAPGNYNVTLIATATFCGKSVSEPIFLDFTALDNIDETQQVSIYPNPVNNKVWVDLPEDNNYSLILHSLTGTQLPLLSNRTQQGFELNTSELLPGIYFLTVQTINARSTFKLIKLEE